MNLVKEAIMDVSRDHIRRPRKWCPACWMMFVYFLWRLYTDPINTKVAPDGEKEE
jgi:hypothetical protein